MLNHPTLDKLQDLRFTGMAKALTEQMALPDIDELSFEERLGLLVDREMTEREDRVVWRLDYVRRNSNKMPASKTSTSSNPAASINP